jgi:DNA polymerase III subunit beta
MAACNYGRMPRLANTERLQRAFFGNRCAFMPAKTARPAFAHERLGALESWPHLDLGVASEGAIFHLISNLFPFMKFSLTKEKLLEGLQIVQSVVSTRTTLPILSNVLVQAAEGQLNLTTTDLDVGVRGSIEATVEKPGSTTLPARRLFSIVRELPSSDVIIEVDSKNVASIRCGSSFFKILGLPEEEFPPLPKFENAKVFSIRQADLRNGLKKTSYAISTDETRYVLNGILCSFKDGKLTLVATDGRRLALGEIELEFPRSQEVEIIIPTKCVNELQRLLGEEGDVKMTVGENQVAFEVSGVLLVSKLIEGNYPNYRQVIPPEARERITIERELFLSAVHRVSLLASEKSNSVKLAFSKNNIDILSNTPDVGEARESLAVQFKGKEMAVAFNPNFLMDPLRNLGEDEIYLDLIDEMSPGVIKLKDPGFTYVLMPMRIS